MTPLSLLLRYWTKSCNKVSSMPSGCLAHISRIAFSPADATSDAAASETNSLAIFDTSGDIRSGGTRLCEDWAAHARNVVTDACRGVRNLEMSVYRGTRQSTLL